MNLDAINEISEDIDKRSKGGANFLSQKELPEEMDFRIIPPRPNMNDIFFVKEKYVWINKKKYVSPETFDEVCPMREVINEAIAKGDPDVITLLKRLEYNGNLDKVVGESYHIPLLRMSVDSRGNILEVPEGTTTLQCTTQLIQRFNKLVSHRNYRGTTEAGEDYYIDHPQHGHNITITRKKKGDGNEYDAIIGKKIAIADEFYAPDKLPNPVYVIRKQMFSDAYLRSVINNYLYGEELIEPEKRYTDKELEEFKNDAAPEVTKKAPVKKVVEKKGVAKKVESPKENATSSSSIEDDLDDLD